MNWGDLSSKGYIKSTGKGNRIGVHIRVYPQGHGQIIIRRETPPIEPIELMCNDVEDAVGYLREIWQTLSQEGATSENE